LEEVMEQHRRYCDALQACGLALTSLEPDLRYPDSTFVEDTAVLTAQVAILARPGAASRQGEVPAIRPAIERFFLEIVEIEPPGTLDGGDICEAGLHFFIGVSHRTNENGARQLAEKLMRFGYTSSLIDVRQISGILHLKSGVSFVGDNTLVLIEEFTAHAAFREYRRIAVVAEESYAANCVRVNDRILIAQGHPRLEQDLERNAFQPLPLSMSEFQKMDGGLSCLSLRF
jgi:dimethylargininase